MSDLSAVWRPHVRIRKNCCVPYRLTLGGCRNFCSGGRKRRQRPAQDEQKKEDGFHIPVQSGGLSNRRLYISASIAQQSLVANCYVRRIDRHRDSSCTQQLSANWRIMVGDQFCPPSTDVSLIRHLIARPNQSLMTFKRYIWQTAQMIGRKFRLVSINPGPSCTVCGKLKTSVIDSLFYSSSLRKEKTENNSLPKSNKNV